MSLSRPRNHTPTHPPPHPPAPYADLNFRFLPTRDLYKSWLDQSVSGGGAVYKMAGLRESESEPSSVDGDGEIQIEIIFCGEPTTLSYRPWDRLCVFVQRFRFVCIIDPGLRAMIHGMTRFDDYVWPYDTDNHVYRLADIAYLLHRLRYHGSESRDGDLHDDLQFVFRLLGLELDELNSISNQIALGLSQQLYSGPSEWLQYYYWCHLVDYLQPNKSVLLRVTPQGLVGPIGESKVGRIHGARQSEGGLIICCGWDWGTSIVRITDVQNLSAYGLSFSDPRMHSSALLRGWSARYLHGGSPTSVPGLHWWRLPPVPH